MNGTWAEQLGFVHPTNVQSEALPILLAGHDCILQSQTGSGKTLCYLFAVLARVKKARAAVQAIVVVPTRELGMQIVREARKLGKLSDVEDNHTTGSRKDILNIMSLLDGGSLSRQKSWLKVNHRFAIFNFYLIVIPGRAWYVAIDIDGILVGFLSVYAHTTPRDRATFWSQLIDALPIVETWIIGGDFNNIEFDFDWCAKTKLVLLSMSPHEQEEWDRLLLTTHTVDA
ncbi:hypothetical protein L7F22_023537 [Adiantum nelumboides]|nr:hypothetical protein [Adiantum nelumboides]